MPIVLDIFHLKKPIHWKPLLVFLLGLGLRLKIGLLYIVAPGRIWGSVSKGRDLSRRFWNVKVIVRRAVGFLRRLCSQVVCCSFLEKRRIIIPEVSRVFKKL